MFILQAVKGVDNEAALQLQVQKANNPFLSTLANQGVTQFLTFQKPCSILLPHVHQRANEFYSVVFGAPPFQPLGFLRAQPSSPHDMPEHGTQDCGFNAFNVVVSSGDCEVNVMQHTHQLHPA